MTNIELIKLQFQWGKDNMENPLDNMDVEDFDYLLESIDKLRRVLRFHASVGNYTVHPDELIGSAPSEIDFDEGSKAREVLEVVK